MKVEVRKIQLLIFSDVHTTKIDIPKVQPDLVVLLGDIYWRTVEEIDRTYTCPKIGVLGNHDPFDNYNRTGIQDIHEQVIDINGLRIAGFGGSPVYSQKETPQYTEWEAERFIEKITAIDLFIAHSNPKLSTYQTDKYSHRGFQAFTTMIYTKKPAYFFHGHLHVEHEQIIGQTNVIAIYPTKLINIDIQRGVIR